MEDSKEVHMPHMQIHSYYLISQNRWVGVLGGFQFPKVELYNTFFFRLIKFHSKKNTCFYTIWRITRHPQKQNPKQHAAKTHTGMI